MLDRMLLRGAGVFWEGSELSTEFIFLREVIGGGFSLNYLQRRVLSYKLLRNYNWSGSAVSLSGFYLQKG